MNDIERIDAASRGRATEFPPMWRSLESGPLDEVRIHFDEVNLRVAEVHVDGPDVDIYSLFDWWSAPNNYGVACAMYSLLFDKPAPHVDKNDDGVWAAVVLTHYPMEGTFAEEAAYMVAEILNTSTEVPAFDARVEGDFLKFRLSWGGREYGCQCLAIECLDFDVHEDDAVSIFMDLLKVSTRA